MERQYPKISINIVAWNSMRFLPDLLASIDKQTFRDFNVFRERMVGRVNHDGRKPGFNAGFCKFKRVSVIEVKCDRNFFYPFFFCVNFHHFDCALPHVFEKGLVGIFPGAA